MSTDAVVVGKQETGLRVRRGEATAYTLLGLLGGAFALVGLVDLGLLWYPPDFGNAGWEFGTLSRTLDSVPMAGLGFGLLAFAAVRHPGRRGGWVRVVGVLFVLAALVFVAMGAMYATVVPEVVSRSPAESALAMNRAVIKNFVEVVVYTLVFGTIGFKLWRTVERSR